MLCLIICWLLFLFLSGSPFSAWISLVSSKRHRTKLSKSMGKRERSKRKRITTKEKRTTKEKKRKEKWGRNRTRNHSINNHPRRCSLCCSWWRVQRRRKWGRGGRDRNVIFFISSSGISFHFHFFAFFFIQGKEWEKSEWENKWISDLFLAVRRWPNEDKFLSFHTAIKCWTRGFFFFFLEYQRALIRLTLSILDVTLKDLLSSSSSPLSSSPLSSSPLSSSPLLLPSSPSPSLVEPEKEDISSLWFGFFFSFFSPHLSSCELFLSLPQFATWSLLPTLGTTRVNGISPK